MLIGQRDADDDPMGVPASVCAEHLAFHSETRYDTRSYLQKTATNNMSDDR